MCAEGQYTRLVKYIEKIPERFKKCLKRQKYDLRRIFRNVLFLFPQITLILIKFIQFIRSVLLMYFLGLMYVGSCNNEYIWEIM